MVTINEWFEKKDYGIGLVLLAQHCRNRMLLQSLSRRKNPAKLEYELGKVRNLEVGSRQLEEKSAVTIADTVRKISHLSSLKEGSAEDGAEQGVVRDNNPDNLPPHLKAKWNENQDAYKEIRALHEKLKLMAKATPEDRQPLTERIALLDDKIRDNWELIDNYDPSQEPEPDNQLQKIDHKRINANRKYISTNLKKLMLKPEEIVESKLQQELQKRYNELKYAGELVSEDTKADLIFVGVKC